MKPIKLTIQAFGPFVGKEEIDFTKLGKNPLFLINGPTGSGKSSILDAICFALYGQTTGAERDASQMRCDQADPKTLTEVTLDFSLGEKKYRIKRTPFQERAKERGEGLTSHSGSAELNEINPSGELNLIVAKKIKQATDEIEKLTGLNVEQFRQVMVLPQGKFRELLLANSYERQQIFSQLFQTYIYKKIEDVLKDKSKVIRDNVKAHQNKIKGILEGADLHTEEAVDASIEEINPLLSDAKLRKDTASASYLKAINGKKSGEALLEGFADQEKTKSSFEEVNKKKNEIGDKDVVLDRAKQGNKIKPVFDELIRVKNEKQRLGSDIDNANTVLGDVKKEHDKAEIDLNRSKDDSKSVDGLKQDINKLNQFEGKVDELEAASTISKKSKYAYNLSKDAVIDAQSKYDEKVQNKKDQENSLSKIQKDLSELGPKLVNLQRLDVQKKQRKRLEEHQSQYNELNTELALAKESFESLSKAFETAAQFAKKQEMYWHASQAAILAEDLKDGVPCPVCGSDNHPKRAKLDESKNAVSKEQKEDAGIRAEKERVSMQAAKDSVTEIASQIYPLGNSIKELEVELGSASSEALESIETAYKALESEVTVLENLKQDLAIIENNLAESSSEIEALLESVDQCKVKEEAANKLNTQDQSAVIHIEKELPDEFRKKTTLLHAIQELESKVQSLTESLNKAQSHYDECKENVTRQTTNIQGLTKRDKTLAKQQIKQQDKWLDLLSSSAFETEQQYLESILEDAQITELSSEISDYHKELNQLKGALKQHDEVLKGKKRPDIELLNKLCDEENEKLKEADTVWNEIHSRQGQLKDVKKKLKKAHDENKKLEDEYAIYGTLSKVANGQTGNKISLQRFVLGVLLDDVLIEASAKLYKMTNGRYQLLRKQDRSKGGGASGLELDVEDSYTGKTRSVATLSGGESFMAALALALGLSDVVQAYAGGIRLDALFIDEGFGSLDQESLDLAIKTLVDLQETGRMIGIISHVSELKEQMAMRLDVVSTKTGSTIKILAA